MSVICKLEIRFLLKSIHFCISLTSIGFKSVKIYFNHKNAQLTNSKIIPRMRIPPAVPSYIFMLAEELIKRKLSVEECCYNGIDAGFKMLNQNSEMCFTYADKFRVAFSTWNLQCDRHFVTCCMRVLSRYVSRLHSLQMYFVLFSLN